MAFASGRYSRAICDRCGQEYKYQQLKKEWNGLFVCPSCYDPKHPQLDPPYHPPDPEAIKDPRVESNKILKDNSPTGPDDATFDTFAQPMPVTVFLGEPGDSAFLTTVQSTSPADGSNPTDSNSMLPQTPHKKLIMQSKIGDNTVDSHPFYLSTTSDGSHNSGSVYTSGVTFKINGSSVSQSAYASGYTSATTRALEITVAIGAPTLYYYCSSHPGMGNSISTP